MVEGSRVRLAESAYSRRADLLHCIASMQWRSACFRGRENDSRLLSRHGSQGSDSATINFVTDDRLQVGSLNTLTPNYLPNPTVCFFSSSIICYRVYLCICLFECLFLCLCSCICVYPSPLCFYLRCRLFLFFIFSFLNARMHFYRSSLHAYFQYRDCTQSMSTFTQKKSKYTFLAQRISRHALHCFERN